VSDSHLPQLPPLPENISFSSELIKARSDLGLTQSQFSSKCGLSLSAIKAYESGRNLPGARELRELSQALQVSPNKLLFGKELPFESRSVMGPVIEAESENEAVSRMRATLLLFMLASDERESILTLARSLAIARHGQEEVQRQLATGDVMTGLIRGMAEATHEALLTKKPIDTDKFAPNLNAFMSRQGHISDPEKLPKKLPKK
jgi:transcriptional regulator with XRE-family HTH domain